MPDLAAVSPDVLLTPLPPEPFPTESAPDEPTGEAPPSPGEPLVLLDKYPGEPAWPLDLATTVTDEEIVASAGEFAPPALIALVADE